MGDDYFIVVKTFGKQYKVCLGKNFYTPQKALGLCLFRCHHFD